MFYGKKSILFNAVFFCIISFSILSLAFLYKILVVFTNIYLILIGAFCFCFFSDVIIYMGSPVQTKFE